MLKRLYRLPAKSRPVNAYVYRGKFFILKKSSTTLPFSRFGFVISKKVAQLAVDRNRSKRLIRSVVERFFLEIKPSDYLFIIKQNLSGIRNDDVEKELKKALGLNQ